MILKKSLKTILRKLICGKYLLKYIKIIHNSIHKRYCSEKYPAGHFYSVIPSILEIEKRKLSIFKKNINLYGIDLNYEEQIELLKIFSKLHESVPFFSTEKKIRFNIENDSFSYDDAPILSYMMRVIKPKRIIEIGSGNSSACMLDTNDLYLNGKVDLTFIDINTNNLKANLRDNDYNNVTIMESPIQEVDLAIFKELTANDMLFIDSSHVMKIGSDLNTILFEILPILNNGVYIHFHDIRYPFQYNEDLIKRKVFWNEAYALRAFLQYNNSFKIFFWLNSLLNIDSSLGEGLASFLPLDGWDRRFNENQNDYKKAGGSIYLVKTKT